MGNRCAQLVSSRHWDGVSLGYEDSRGNLEKITNIGGSTHAGDLPKFDPAHMSEALIQFVVTLKVWFIYQLMYPISLFFVKLSVLAFYRRLSPNKTYQRAIWITGGIVTLYTIIMVLLNAFECKNPSDAWNPATWPRGCRDLVPIYYGQAGFNIASDIVILVLPIPTLLKLQINKTKRSAYDPYIAYNCL